MSNESQSGLIPTSMQPTASDVAYDLETRLKSVVSLKAHIPDDAFTAEILGTEREGHGAVINDRGTIATIGYLVTEAESVWIHAANGQVVAGDVLGYDYESGFGLVQPLGRLDIPPFDLGDSDTLKVHAKATVAGYGGPENAVRAEIVARSEFVGYWEYIVDRAIFTSPPHPNWGGAALIGDDGKLYGIGSLYTQVTPGNEHIDGNMIVPINLLSNILDELMQFGQTTKPARPWLGMFATDTEDGLVVAGLYDGAPAHKADLRAGDHIVSVAGNPIAELSDFFRLVWSLGPAGTLVPITIARDGKKLDVDIVSTDRRSHWKSPQLH